MSPSPDPTICHFPTDFPKRGWEECGDAVAPGDRLCPVHRAVWDREEATRGRAPEKRKPKTIALDFDGVVHSYANGWTGVEPKDPPTIGARAFVDRVKAMGYRVVIFTCRALTSDGLAAIVAWLAAHKIGADEVTAWKPHADVYIDDRAHRFDGDWLACLDVLYRPTVRPEPETEAVKHAPMAFEPACGLCGTKVARVEPSGRYDPCGHSVPGGAVTITVPGPDATPDEVIAAGEALLDALQDTTPGATIGLAESSEGAGPRLPPPEAMHGFCDQFGGSDVPW